MSNDSLNLSDKSDELSKISEASRAAIDDEQQESEIVSSFAKAKIDEEVDVKSQLNVFHLHSHIWRITFQYLSENDIITLSSVCKQFQKIVHDTKSGFNLRKNYRLDVGCFLNFALSMSCTSIDISYCEWLTPSTIIEMISKTNLRHLHLINCQVNEDCVRSICSLQLQSLSFTYTDEWRSYFIEYVVKLSLPFVQTLTKLEIEFSQPERSPLNLKTFIFDIFMILLQHCKRLQNLKLVEVPYICWYEVYKTEASDFTTDSTPLLELTSLEVVIEQEECQVDLVNFLKVILKDKIIPLKNIDFGRYTCHLLQDGILFHPLILPQSKLILRNRYKSYLGDDEDEYFEDCEDIYYQWMGQRTYETFVIDKLNFVDFEPFAKRIISNSGKSIKQLHIRNCFFVENLLKGIELFAVNCPQMTALHVTIKESRIGGSYNHDDMVENEAFIEILTHFKNLKELVILPAYLQSIYSDEDGSQWVKAMPFYKVTEGCQQLNKMCIEVFENGKIPRNYISAIHVGSLYAIARSKNLKELKLSTFRIIGEEIFRMSDIIKSCAKLEQLTIDKIVHQDLYLNNRFVPLTFDQYYYANVYDFDCYGETLNEDRVGEILAENHSENFIFNHSLSYTKDLKILRIAYRHRYMNKAFLNSLCLCEKLESVYFCLRGSRRQRKRDVQHLIEILQKLKNLVSFGILVYEVDSIIIQPLKMLINKMKSERPAFSGYFYG